MNERETNSSECEEMSVKITLASKETMDVAFKGRVARFCGELGLHEFMACVDSVRWLYQEEREITPREKEEIIAAVRKQQNNKETKILFCDVNYNVITDTAEGKGNGYRVNGCTQRGF